MKGRTRCPYCTKNVAVEVPDTNERFHQVKCPYCEMTIRVDTSSKREQDTADTPLHPLLPMTQKPSTSKPMIAAVCLIAVSILGFSMGASYFLGDQTIFEGDGTYKGQVVNENGEGISGATIQIDENGILVNVTLSDTEGYFSFNATAGTHKLQIQKGGYPLHEAEIGVFPFASIFTEQFVLKNESGGIDKKLTAQVFGIIPMMFIAALVFSVPPLVGAVCCLKRKVLIGAVIGSLLGIFSLGFLVGSLLSFVALILIVISREEFE